MTTTNALYTDLSGYYDLMCSEIDYLEQSACAMRLHQLFGNGNHRHLDLACGTGPHIRHFLDRGYISSGLDLNQPMLELAQQRCPEASFSQQNICDFTIDTPLDLITCFLYSVHYSQTVARLAQCLASVHRALAQGGMFCFNAVDKDQITNDSAVRHRAELVNEQLLFESSWFYSGSGEQQALRLHFTKTRDGQTEYWHDEHPMVAVSFPQLLSLLEPWFEVTVLAHDYQTITPWNGQAGNALFICVKR